MTNTRFLLSICSFGADFCTDAEAKAAVVERSMKDNVPLSEDANRDLLRAHTRVGKVGPFISQIGRAHV